MHRVWTDVSSELQITVHDVDMPDGGTVPVSAMYPTYEHAPSASRSLEALSDGALVSKNHPAASVPLPSQSES